MKIHLSQRFLALSTSLLLASSACGPISGNTAATACTPTDQDQYIYHPERLEVKSACIRVTGIVNAVRSEPDGDVHIRLDLDQAYRYLLTDANDNQYGDLVVEPVCYHKVTQEDALDTCASDPDPYSRELPEVGQHIWMEGRYVLDKDHGSWAELHPLYRWGPVD